MKWFVESEFEHAGLKCICIATNGGWRCGYVGVDKTHPKYQAEYGNVDVDVHGGLTFGQQGSGKFLAKKLWWFGFDCNHYGDAIDKTLLDDETREAFGRMSCPGDRVCSLNYVVDECKGLAEQLAAMQKEA